MDLSPSFFSYSSFSSDSEIYNISSPESAREGRPKPRRMRSKNPSRQRRNASEKEKLRMRDLTKSLHYLRTFLPPFVAPTGQTLTKIETLRLAIRYISYLSSQLHLQISSCQNDGLRCPHLGSDSDSCEEGNLRKEMKAFCLQRNKNPHEDFYGSWTAGNEQTEKPQEEQEHRAYSYSDILRDQELYQARHVTIQTEHEFLQAESDPRDGMKMETQDSDGIFSFAFESLVEPQTSPSPQDYSKAVLCESTELNFWI